MCVRMDERQRAVSVHELVWLWFRSQWVVIVRTIYSVYAREVFFCCSYSIFIVFIGSYCFSRRDSSDFSQQSLKKPINDAKKERFDQIYHQV